MYTQSLCVSGRTAMRLGFMWIAIGVLSACSNTSQIPVEPAEEPVAAAPTPEVTTPMPSPGIDVGTLEHTFYFEFDEAVLSMRAQSELKQHAEWMQDNPDRKLVIEGHADERGSREYNLALGESRGDVVKAFLVAHGVSEANIEVVSYGEERPAVQSQSESGWSMNRRAQMQYAGGTDLAKHQVFE